MSKQHTNSTSKQAKQATGKSTRQNINKTYQVKQSQIIRLARDHIHQRGIMLRNWLAVSSRRLHRSHQGSSSNVVYGNIVVSSTIANYYWTSSVQNLVLHEYIYIYIHMYVYIIMYPAISDLCCIAIVAGAIPLYPSAK